MLGLLGSLAFNFILHMDYGTELFLYALYWTYLLVFFPALAHPVVIINFSNVSAAVVVENNYHYITFLKLIF